MKKKDEKVREKVKKEKHKKKEKKEKKEKTPAARREQRKHVLKGILFFILAILFYALGISFFFGPSGLTPGGLSGIAIAVERFGFLPFGKGVIVLILNIPIVLIGLRKFGIRFLGGTIAAVVASSALMELFDRLIVLLKISTAFTSPIVPAVGGGVLVGISVGCIMRAGATFGGTDIVVKLLRLKYKYMQTGTFYLFVDGAIVAIGTLCATFRTGRFDPAGFSVEILVCSVLAIFVQSYFANFVLYGSDGARMIYIITTKEEEISRRINEELHSGVTYLQGKGAYTGGDRQILLCAMRKQNLPGARKIVLEEDPAAFMIVTSASQVLGKGFKHFDEEDL